MKIGFRSGATRIGTTTVIPPERGAHAKGLVAAIILALWVGMPATVRSADLADREMVLAQNGVEYDDPLGIEMPTWDQSDDEGAVDPWAYDEASELKITVNGIAKARGRIVVFVYDDEHAFTSGDYTAAVGYAEAAAASGSIVMTVPVAGVSPYAVFVHHDANSDGQINIREGRPQEGYGVSGGLDPYSPKQSYRRAATVRDAASIRIVYLSNPFLLVD